MFELRCIAISIPTNHVTCTILDHGVTLCSVSKHLHPILWCDIQNVEEKEIYGRVPSGLYGRQRVCESQVQQTRTSSSTLIVSLFFVCLHEFLSWNGLHVLMMDLRLAVQCHHHLPPSCHHKVMQAKNIPVMIHRAWTHPPTTRRICAKNQIAFTNIVPVPGADTKKGRHPT